MSNAPVTEAGLIERAQLSISSCNWEVGRCASLWTQRFARGRTDADFAVLVGLSADQVYQRRRTFETFGDVWTSYPDLKWSHFYSSLNWDDAAECLEWANSIQATVQEMKVWRRAQRGEDLGDEGLDESSPLMDDPSLVRMPAEEAPFDTAVVAGTGGGYGNAGNAIPVIAGVARAAEGSTQEPYTPFHSGAITPPDRREHSASQREAVSPDVAARRLTTALERCAAVLSGRICRGIERDLGRSPFSTGSCGRAPE